MTAYSSRELSHPPSIEASKTLLSEILSKSFARGPHKLERPLVLYGGGNMGRMALEYFHLLGIPVVGVVDMRANEIRADKFWAGIEAMTPDTATDSLRKDALLAICVATSPYTPLAESLREIGWQHIVPFYDVVESFRDRHPLSNGWYADHPSQMESDLLAEALSRWSDDVSRAHHLQFLAWRGLREEWSFKGAPVVPENRFFIPEVKKSLGDKEHFLDVGAHVGQVLHRFIAETSGHFSKITAIEPDSKNRDALNLSLTAEPSRDRIEVLPHIIGADDSSCVFYEGLGYPSQRSDLGKTRAQMKTIDSLDISPSIIKLHLEGWELDALKGAEQTIKRTRPIVMATSYHNALGLWEMPLWFMNTLEGYRFLMRQHTWCGTGTVIYAIPERRG